MQWDVFRHQHAQTRSMVAGSLRNGNRREEGENSMNVKKRPVSSNRRVFSICLLVNILRCALIHSLTHSQSSNQEIQDHKFSVFVDHVHTTEILRCCASSGSFCSLFFFFFSFFFFFLVQTNVVQSCLFVYLLRRKDRPTPRSVEVDCSI